MISENFTVMIIINADNGKGIKKSLHSGSDMEVDNVKNRTY